jgi:hypothetical protein
VDHKKTRASDASSTIYMMIIKHQEQDSGIRRAASSEKKY